MTDPYQYNIYLRIVEKLMGENVPSQSRVRKYFVARAMCVYQMHLDGCGNSEIARQCGKNHSSVFHMVDEMGYILDHPDMYQEEMKLWKQFQENKHYGIQ